MSSEVSIAGAHDYRRVEELERQLAEAHQREAATAEVLKSIGRSTFDLQRVLDTLTETAARLCGADKALIRRCEEGRYVLASSYAFNDEFNEWAAGRVLSAGRDNIVSRAVSGRTPVHISDVLAEPGWDQGDWQTLGNFRSALAVPLLHGDDILGVLVLHRTKVLPFTEKQIALVETFAHQAVIAIENARLFDEVQARTRDLQESLQQQIATGDVLKVISRSAFNLQTVLDTLVESATRLCDAQDAIIFLPSGETYRPQALHGYSTQYHKFIESNPIAIDRGSVVGRTAIEKQVVHISDVLADPDYTRLDAQRMAGYRTALGVPLLREGNVAGVIFLTRTKPQPFTQKQIELITTFADQAVIAIENARLFDEVQAKTRDLQASLDQQTATADVLKVISRSAFDLQTVLQTLVESVARLCDADMVQITRQRDGAFFRAEAYGFPDEYLEYTRAISIVPSRGSAMGRVLLDGTPINIADALADPEYTFTEAQRLSGFRAVLAVPMLREGVPIGIIVMTRRKPRPFAQKHIELATTFADQAAIAIGNVQLFDAVQERTRELTKSLDDLRTAQERLIQTEKLASLGQLTAGIAHEIKNPLNFINNFSALSAELTDELKDLLKRESLSDKGRKDVDELTGLLTDNLGKVVQHGKRADSIVKNMLLHSREGSGERRSADINALVGESLNLAYHGARAEKSSFNITLRHDLDPEAGAAELYPQEITRALLNLISNGFYAATRRKAEAGDEIFEPALIAVTKNLGRTIEIRIRDNGMGIPPEVREKMFNPFFTTKPTGEGTGLGLSMTHDIIVKQHGGRIDVETEPGVYTEFIITLPRDNGR